MLGIYNMQTLCWETTTEIGILMHIHIYNFITLKLLIF